MKKFEGLLQNQLKDYIEKADLRMIFETKIPQEMTNAFENYVSTIPFFDIVRDNKLQELKKLQPKRGNAAKIEKCIRDTIGPLFERLTS